MSQKESLEGFIHFYIESGMDGGYWSFQNSNYIFGDYWNYKGLHILQDGDYLTIYHPKNKKEIWSGEINFQRNNSFIVHSSRMKIHAVQIGIDKNVWAEYFFKEYPAKLILTKNNDF